MVNGLSIIMKCASISNNAVHDNLLLLVKCSVHLHVMKLLIGSSLLSCYLRFGFPASLVFHLLSWLLVFVLYYSISPTFILAIYIFIFF